MISLELIYPIFDSIETYCGSVLCFCISLGPYFMFHNCTSSACERVFFFFHIIRCSNA
ncbi:hypothetical protein GLOIN_2v1642249 [Rhizophagus irregularis DAOM 181602=DAOM 197198]|uniref:Uncharacterized protein n=1 Tax=Rhizophagus irregularis (strain DAOM 181602 / DAOM 197198 / MUCL 43194) TaxID=747089 RepID=A0A2P4PR88_RHIID|nr:hypothetical protein GLOIN_2v1642249 [Rhizophagus irregularis DAOM 181602=DAOM 197198]POG67896.1 hypothetical protein GLOIN_2v1642249 [Rhizophagus irregularis DAOM 181602=DAOM 197198]GET52147.1 hypothetical protein GLOIN_2v1642249 [Rhizophagus irregularis DAOM 181602=DAOM 197198]|eukprot:XP_025174762.1 hypothetical protein GLOIN_2v1642249 [Rhizophagus irregularis DAOM 181602=DAOM 197198]